MDFSSDYLQMAYRLLAAVAAGACIGYERSFHGRPAGLRTHVLVCLGSTMFVLTTKHAVAAFGSEGVDATRIVHGVVTGVGFLGAGSIMRTEGFVFGLTTAASVWMVAAVGVAVGVHAYPLAAIGAVMALIVLEGYRWLERMTDREDGDGE